ncbi:MAG: hypothetical protein LWY06_18530 [Firmicutes bacterium]|nr:hypothetical protein [Bacillota bacterium]
MNLRWLASAFIISLTLCAGCKGGEAPTQTSPAPSAVSSSVAASPLPEFSPEVSPEGKNTGSPAPSENIGKPGDSGKDDVDAADGDDDSNLEDMYVRIYGEKYVVMNGDKPRFDSVGFAKLYKKSTTEAIRREIRLKTEEADKIETQGEDFLPEAAKLYREAEMLGKLRNINTSRISAKLEEMGNIARMYMNELVLKRQFRKALPWADTAVICNPSDSRVLETAGDVFSETGEEGLAKAYFMEAILLEPNNSKLRYKLKHMYILEGDFEKALPLVNQQTASFGRTKSVHDDLAQVYLGIYLKNPSKRKETDKLIREHLSKAVKETSNVPTSKAELEMNLALYEKNYDKAVELCRSMLKMKFSRQIQTRLIYNIALLEYLRGNKTECIKNLKTVVARVLEGNSPSQSENYMAQMASWFLELSGEEPFDSGKAADIYSMAKESDHSYRQEYSFISGYLQSRESKKYQRAAGYLEKYIGKRHLEPVGDFVQDLLQVPAQKSLIYLSLADMYSKTGKKDKAEKLYKEIRESDFLKELATSQHD